MSARRFTWFSDGLRDARYACRTLRRSPSFTIVAVATLALGIGATTVIYNVVNTILVRPLPFADSDRLVRIAENVPSRATGRVFKRGLTYPDFLEWRTRTRTLSDIVAVTELGRIVKTADGTARLWGAMLSPEAFSLLGSRPLVGRTLTAVDAGNPDVVVLGFDAWRRLFHSDRSVVGATMALRSDWNGSYTPEREDRILTIVGVMPASFEFPAGSTDFYTPFLLDDLTRRSPIVSLIARLRRGVSKQAAIEEANIIGSAIRPPRPANAPPLTVSRFEIQNLKDERVQGLRPALRVFVAAVAAVLLLVCANVANLLLARGTAREREIAVRFAIGASRARIVRQILTECLVLAAAGGATGALLAATLTALVKRLASVEAPGLFRFAFPSALLPRVSEIGLDSRMFAFAVGASLLSSLAFGLLPALQVSQRSVAHGMASRGAARTASRARSALVVGQLVLATVLLVAAGLLLRSFVQLARIDNGYDPSNVLTFQLVLPAEYAVPRKTETIEAVLSRVRALPEVQAAGFTRAGILIPEEIHVGTFVPQGRTLEEMRADPTRPRLRPASRGYLAAAGVRVLDGRELSDADSGTAPPVAVVSRTVAQRYFGAGSPVGRSIDWYVGKAAPVHLQVVGLVEDIRNESPGGEAYPDVFVDYRQLLALEQRWGDSPRQQNETAIGFVSFAVRTRDHSAAVGARIGRIVRDLDPEAGVEAMIPMDRLVASALARPRFYAVVLGTFAAVAGILAAIGIYGVLACAVSQRTREIGVRMALGAQRAQVLGLVLGRGLVLTAIGIVLVLAGAAAATRLLQGMLFGVTPLDAPTFIAVALMFAIVATAASYIPARRATQVNPIDALRSE